LFSYCCVYYMAARLIPAAFFYTMEKKPLHCISISLMRSLCFI
jgi:hypothetical protein